MSNFEDDNEELRRVEEQNLSLQESHGDPEPGDELQANDDLSMASSVTRHTQISQQDEPQIIKQLSFGIDTLDVGMFVDWGYLFPQLNKKMEEGKLHSQNKKTYYDPEHHFLHLPKGKAPNYRWHVQTPDFDVYIADRQYPNGETPNVFVSFRSRKLWLDGLIQSMLDLNTFIKTLGGKVYNEKINRVDLAADYIVDKPISQQFIQFHRVPNDTKNTYYHDSDSLETFYQGSNDNEIRMRLYDKSKEIEKSNKHWFYDIWQVPVTTNIYRIEFQFRRTLLKKNRIDLTASLLGKMKDLWAYATEKYFSLRHHDNQNVSRRSIHPFWKQVQNAIIDGNSNSITRIPNKSYATPKWHLNTIKNSSMTLAVYHGKNTKSECLEFISDLLDRNIDPIYFDHQFNTKTIRLGLNNEPAEETKNFMNLMEENHHAN